MVLMECRNCSTKFAVGLLRCPQCNSMSELYAAPEEVIEAEQEANMPKISVEGGPSNALGEPTETEAPAVEPEALVAESAEPAAQSESETSDAAPAVTDEVPELGEGAADAKPSGAAETESAPEPAPKPARKTAAKKAAAKQEPAPKG